MSNCESIKIAEKYSNDKIKKLRDSLKKVCVDQENIFVVTVGSFARREASEQSDIDFYVIYDDVDEQEIKKVGELIKRCIESSGIRMPSDGGAFNEGVSRNELLENIGGNNDSNKTLTRRMLFLLECEWLYNENLYKKLREKIIELYVKDTITQHTLCRFLLNDLIRYYRTMCVDFEYKTVEVGKSWGDRNIKLMFSRKLIYFSGILTIAETVQHTCKSKREILSHFFSMTPKDRIVEICGWRANKVLEMYDNFLSEMAKEDVRDLLNKTTEIRETSGDGAEEGHKEEFRRFKNQGHHFSWEVAKLLSATYDVSHPIHHAIKF